MAGGIIGNLMFAVGFKVADKAIQDADNKLGGLKKTFGSVGIAAVATAATITGIGVAAFAAASEFEDAMSSVQMATGATADQMEDTREVAKSLYSQNFGADWQDLGSAIQAVQQVTQQTGSELETTTRNALLLRDAFGFEINESVKATDTMMRQFGITSEQSMNLLAQGAQSGLDKSGELMDTANEYANQFKSLGFSANEMFDVFAAGSAEGVFQLDKIGDSVKEFNIRSKDSSKTSIEAFQMLGLNAEQMMSTFAAGGPEAKKAFSQVIQMISAVEDPVAQNTIGVALMGSQFEDLEATTIAAMGTARTQFDMTRDKMGEMNQVKFNKPGEAFAMFRRQMETGILIPIGEKLLPYLNQFGQWMADHKPQIQAVGETIGNYVGVAIDAVSLAIQTMLPHIQDAWTWITDVASALGSWEPFLPIVVGLTTAIVAYKVAMSVANIVSKRAMMTTRIWTAAQAAFNVVMALNPITLVIAAIVGLVGAIVIAYKRSETFRNIINNVWTSIKTAFVTSINFIKTTAIKVFNAIVSFLREWGLVILGVITGPIGLVVSLVIKYWDQIKTFTITIFTAVWDWISNIFNSIVTSISNAVSAAWSFVSNGWNNMVESIKTAGSNIWSNVTSIWDKVIGFLSRINLFDIGKNIIDGLVNGIKSMANTVVESAQNIAGSISDTVKGWLGIHSPSRVMMEFGQFTGEGLAIGIEGTQSRVYDASSSLSGEVVKGAAPTALAPARTTNSQSSSSKLEVSIFVKADGSGSNAQAESQIVNVLKLQLQEALESAARQSGISVSVEVS